jgi:hypothetical protein
MVDESRESRKYTTVIGYVDDFPGADVSNDAISVILTEDDVGGIDVDLDGESVVVDSWSAGVLSVTDDGNFTIVDSNGTVIEEPLDVSDSTVTVTDDGNFTIVDSNGTVIEEPLDVSDSTVTVTDDGSLSVNSISDNENREVGLVRLRDDSGNTVDPMSQPSHPNKQVSGHDLDADGDLAIGPLPLDGTSGVIISVNSTSNSEWSASVDWVDNNGNTYQQEQPSDIGLNSVVSDWARLVRKAPMVEVTITDESGGTNNVNAHVDTEV